MSCSLRSFPCTLEEVTGETCHCKRIITVPVRLASEKTLRSMYATSRSSFVTDDAHQFISIPIPPPSVGLVLPTGVHCVVDDVEVFLKDTTDEEHFDIVFDGDELRVVDPRLSRYLLALCVDPHTHWVEPKRRLSLERSWFRPFLVDDSMLLGLRALLVTSLLVVSQDWTRTSISNWFSEQ